MSFAEKSGEKQKRWPRFVFPLIFCFSIPFVILYLVSVGDMLFRFFPDKPLAKALTWPIDSDFINYWSAAKLALDGHIMTVFDQQAFWNAQKDFVGFSPAFRNNWSYPPHVLPLILPFGLLPYHAAFFLWEALTFAFYAVAVTYKRPESWKLAAILAIAPASVFNILFGQNGFLIAACFVGGLRLIDKRPLVAGLLFGVLTIKPPLILLLPIVLLLGKNWRVLFSTALTAAVLVAICLLLFGVDPWLAYFHETVPYQTMMFEKASAADKHGVNSSFITFFSAVRRLDGSLTLAYGLSLLSTATAVLATFYACRRKTSPDLRDAIILTAVFLASPYAHHYDMTLLTPAVISFFAAPRVVPMSLSQILLIVALCFFPLYCRDFNLAGFPVGPLLITGFLGIGLHELYVERKQLPKTA